MLLSMYVTSVIWSHSWSTLLAINVTLETPHNRVSDIICHMSLSISNGVGELSYSQKTKNTKVTSISICKKNWNSIGLEMRLHKDIHIHKGIGIMLGVR